MMKIQEKKTCQSTDNPFMIKEDLIFIFEFSLLYR